MSAHMPVCVLETVCVCVCVFDIGKHWRLFAYVRRRLTLNGSVHARIAFVCSFLSVAVDVDAPKEHFITINTQSASSVQLLGFHIFICNTYLRGGWSMPPTRANASVGPREQE